MLMRTDKIIKRSSDNNKPKNRNRPIHIRRARIWSDGEETHDKSDGKESQSAIVADASPLPQRPSTKKQGLAADAPQTHAGDGDKVGEDEGGVGEGDDGVKGHVGAEVEGRDDEGDAEDDDERVDRDVPAWADLGKR